MARKKGDWMAVHFMAKSFDGSGVVRIQTTESAAERMKLARMPYPKDRGQVIDGTRVVNVRRHSQNAGSTAYRVMWPEHSNGPESKLVTSRFSLSSAHNMETVHVLAEFLRAQEVPFVGIANKDGSLLRDVRLLGSDLAYLTRDIPHSPACHLDFPLADSPEL